MFIRKVNTYLRYLGLLLLSGLLVSCGFESTPQETKKKVVYTTIYPLYILTKQLTQGSNSVEVTSLIPEGKDQHHFEPSARDMAKLKTADLFLAHGGGVEDFLDNILSQIKGKSTIITTDQIADKSKAQGHTWLNAKYLNGIVSSIVGGLTQIDPANKYLYDSKGKEMLQKTQQYHERIDSFKHQKEHLFFLSSGFEHLAEQFKVKVVSVGAHEHEEISPKQLQTLLQEAVKAQATGVFYEATGDPSKDKEYEERIQAFKLKPRKVYSLESSVDGLDFFQMFEANLQAVFDELEGK